MMSNHFYPIVGQPLVNNIPEGEGFLFPENSYNHNCGCGIQFLAPKGSLHCYKCLYAEIESLRAQVEVSNSNYYKMLHEVAKKYDGNDLAEWSIGANHVFKLFAKWVGENTPKQAGWLRDSNTHVNKTKEGDCE